MYLLDTNIISELRKPRPHGALLAWYESHPQYMYYLPSIVLYELQAGVEITRDRDPIKAAEIEAWIDRVVASASILPLDTASARTTARFLRHRPAALFEDAMIAAIAQTHRLTVATRNVKDFTFFNVPVVNPFTHGV